MPRTLAAALGSSVSNQSRKRGDAYFRSGCVSILDTSEMTVSASVRGTRVYQVALTLDEHRLVVDCTCPYFEDSIEVCKHIWAVVLAADRARTFEVPDSLWFDFEDDDF